MLVSSSAKASFQNAGASVPYDMGSPSWRAPQHRQSNPGWDIS
jgi:hypothetical protein